MSSSWEKRPKPLQWRLECLGHSLVEGLAGLLPGKCVFRMGEYLGGWVWHFMPLRRKIVLRNLRIAYAGEKELPELRSMARDSFRRTGASLISAAHTTRLTPEKLRDVIHIENIFLLENALASGRGVVLLLAHMGNWEILSRIIHLFPEGSSTGAFYRPLNNPLLDERVLARRQADGTRMFSKRDPFHQVTGFLREGGIVGVLADQRVGMQGEVVRFFGRLTRASPLPSLLARRSKSAVLALSVVTETAGKWKAVFTRVDGNTTPECMVALEKSMKSGPVDVFWLQDRWKVYLNAQQSIHDWLGPDTAGDGKPHRALLWLAGVAESWVLPAAWIHPDVVYEAAITSDRGLPSWLPASTRVHEVSAEADRTSMRKLIDRIDSSAALPLDFVLTSGRNHPLYKAACREGVPVISLP
jgi:KDO2-lipid IV(A) lauroyltransferase